MGILYLIRHGITSGNERRLYYGSTNLELTDAGKLAVSDRVNAGIYPSADGFSVVTSSLRRTKETAMLIYGDREYISDSRLNELNFGKFEMKSYNDLKDNPEYLKWISGDNWKNVCPDGESGELMVERAGKAMEEYKNGRYIIICHGGIIASFMEKWFPGDMIHKNFYEWQPKPCEGYMAEFDSAGRPLTYKEIKM